MVEDTIPNVDAKSTDQRNSESFEQAEAKILQANADAYDLSNSETNQRIRLRWIAVALALIIIIFMAFVFGHSVHQMTQGYVDTSSSSVALALVVGPIASITAITLTFFVGAFRKFDENDREKAINGMNSGLSFFRGDS